ncbi:hypothetical protein AK830_g7249 [Neonectria ditissima]|uniref:UBC core domain-containing protein n=1 Tax=Neonectria ditissima TaxID=78410 RepID=A0A0P7BFB9_9HYPO|nr:hypothetical protein AK830_g7249 [Neonectria ditissima]
MGLKQFNLDIQAAKSIPCDKVSEVRRGDSDGEIVFTYTPENLPPIEIQALATDVDSYPKGSSFLVFTSSEHAGKALVTSLQGLAVHAEGKAVAQVIEIISTRLTAKLDPTAIEPAESLDNPSHDLTSGSESAFDADDYSDSEGEYEMELDPLPPRRPATLGRLPTIANYESLKRFKRDMRQANAAGFFVSLLAMDTTNRAAGIFSLSIRVSKLGIPEEALEAWDLKNSEYVVMAVKIPFGYPSVSEYLALPSDQSVFQIRFGKCAGPRPSLSTARAAFGHKDNDETNEGDKDTAGNPDDSGDMFMSLYMSGSLNSLLNQELMDLVLIRRRQELSWDQAQALKFKLSRGDHRRIESDENVEEIGSPEREPLPSLFNKELLQHDYALDDQQVLNISLVAMQFGLQRLVRCTKYCMVCHQRTNGSFEAVKPFVCDERLCLYQYLALGFGQSIEHEIINNPYVVDLLISFFHSAVQDNRIREFPKGLNLRCAYTGSLREPAEHLDVEVSFLNKMIRFGSADYSSYSSIKEGQFVLLVLKDIDQVPTRSILTGGLERHVCIVEAIAGELCTFRIISTLTEPPNCAPPPASERPTQATHPTENWMRVLLFKHDTDIDNLENYERNISLMLMTHAIPPVLEMREYLMERPGRRLSSWKRMDVSTLALLNWIVASNRSFIVQDAPVPNLSETEPPTDQPNSVKGMDPIWMQFRFAQGSPEKEQKFIQELELQRPESGRQRMFPSLFAWHGSPLGNWHDIIRTGLDFSSSIHGRAYGNGVYFSSQFMVSNGYSGMQGIQGTHSVRPFTGWSNSHLRATSAISICEVINEPAQFVSSTPHYVVDKVEWIQCRYLFVRVNPTQAAVTQPFPKPLACDSLGYLEQDPSRALVGPLTREVKIPVSAIPIRRREELMNKVSNAGQVTLTANARAESVTGKELKDDIDDLFDCEDESRKDTTVRQRRRSSEDSGMGISRPFKLTTSMQESKNASIAQDRISTRGVSTSDFRPGALDIDSFPKVLEPTWAASSPAALRSINREIKDLHRIQEKTDLLALGWYIDFDKLSNLFCWIVEFHTFDESLPLARDMKRAGCSSVVLEFRFGSSFPLSPPFVRVVRPRFLPFAQGGGGHVTIGGAICSELLTNSGWSPALSLEKVFLEVRTNLCDVERPARLETSPTFGSRDYAMGEAVEAFRRAAESHKWQLPEDFSTISTASSY